MRVVARLQKGVIPFLRPPRQRVHGILPRLLIGSDRRIERSLPVALRAASCADLYRRRCMVTSRRRLEKCGFASRISGDFGFDLLLSGLDKQEARDDAASATAPRAPRWAEERRTGPARGAQLRTFSLGSTRSQKIAHFSTLSTMRRCTRLRPDFDAHCRAIIM